MVILFYLFVILNCLAQLTSQADVDIFFDKLGDPRTIEVKDAKSYWRLYAIVHQAGSLPLLSMNDIVQSLIKLHDFTNYLEIDRTRKSYINQRLDGLINMKEPKECTMTLVHQLARAEEENQDYTMHLVPYIHLMADRLLVGCQKKVANEVKKMRAVSSDSMEIFNKLLEYVLRAQITEGEDAIPGFDYQNASGLERPFDYIPHQQIVNGLVDYLDENCPARRLGKNPNIYDHFDNNMMRQVTMACKEVMTTGESTLDKFDAIYEADPTKVNSFDDRTLKFLTGLRVCEHLKYINTDNVIEYYKLYRNRAKFNIKKKKHELSVRQKSAKGKSRH